MGINLKKLKQIQEGYTNLILDTGDKELADSRAKICAECPVFNNNFCDKKKGGCGCFIPAKVRCKDCKCPQNKW